jgi:hypothetical protein
VVAQEAESCGCRRLSERIIFIVRTDMTPQRGAPSSGPLSSAQTAPAVAPLLAKGTSWRTAAGGCQIIIEGMGDGRSAAA